MTNKLEVYLRHSSNRALLMFHLPESSKKHFLDSLKRGEVAGSELKMSLELSVLPDWITDPDEREKFERSGDHIHIRVPLSAITATYSTDTE